jgi:hypothetical protein
LLKSSVVAADDDRPSGWSAKASQRPQYAASGSSTSPASGWAGKGSRRPAPRNLGRSATSQGSLNGCLGHAERTCKEQGVDKPLPKTFSDYRKLFDAMTGQIDAVFVATPDNHHASASMMAIKRGRIGRPPDERTIKLSLSLPAPRRLAVGDTAD